MKSPINEHQKFYVQNKCSIMTMICFFLLIFDVSINQNENWKYNQSNWLIYVCFNWLNYDYYNNFAEIIFKWVDFDEVSRLIMFMQLAIHQQTSLIGPMRCGLHNYKKKLNFRMADMLVRPCVHMKISHPPSTPQFVRMPN
jgi:hypothetical protein